MKYLNVCDSEPDRSFTYEWAFFSMTFFNAQNVFFEKSWNLNDCKITFLSVI